MPGCPAKPHAGAPPSHGLPPCVNGRFGEELSARTTFVPYVGKSSGCGLPRLTA